MSLPDDNEEVPTDTAHAEEVVDLREVRIAELEGKLNEAEARLRAVSKAYAEQRTEITASRERAEQHLKNMIARREGEVARIFFEPIQNLKRGLETETADAEALVAGLRMVLGQCLDGLHRLGLREVPGVGASFDPNLHEAIGVQAVEDPDEDNSIVVVYQPGYTVGSVVLQPAKVIVGRHTAEPVPEA